MGEHREFVGFYENMGEGVWAIDDQIADPSQEVVRCRDCKRFRLDNSDHDHRSGWWCDRWDTDTVDPNGFCAWGGETR